MRVDADDFARPGGDGNMHHEIKEILIEPGAVNALEEAMSEGFLKEYISPLLICDTNTCKATEEIMEDIYDRCQVLVLDADELQADQHAIEIVENYMDEDIDLILDWRVLGYGILEPWEKRSNTKQDAFNKGANNRAEIFLAKQFCPTIKRTCH